MICLIICLQTIKLIRSECVDNMLMSQFYKNFNESDEKFVDVDKTCEGLNLWKCLQKYW